MKCLESILLLWKFDAASCVCAGWFKFFQKTNKVPESLSLSHFTILLYLLHCLRVWTHCWWRDIVLSGRQMTSAAAHWIKCVCVIKITWTRVPSPITARHISGGRSRSVNNEPPSAVMMLKTDWILSWWFPPAPPPSPPSPPPSPPSLPPPPSLMDMLMPHNRKWLNIDQTFI